MVKDIVYDDSLFVNNCVLPVLTNCPLFPLFPGKPGGPRLPLQNKWHYLRQLKKLNDKWRNIKLLEN